MDIDSSLDELSSDEELQEELLKGNLKPGLVVRNNPIKTYTNDVAGMREKLAKLKENEMEWLERADITSAAPLGGGGEEGVEEDSQLDPEDDFKREMLFYNQAQTSAVVGLRKLGELGVPTRRPDDYYAEMVKTDDHMRRVRQSLLSRQKMLEGKEKARKLRELKKYGKKVQHEILEKRRQEKKETLEAVKKFKKGRGGRPSFLGEGADTEEDHFPVSAENFTPSREKGSGKRGLTESQKSKKRVVKDKKFGFGGKKRWSKSNTRESSADMSSFSAARHSRKTGNMLGRGKPTGGAAAKGKRRGNKERGLGRVGKKKNKTVRLGKSRRKKL